MDTNKIIQDIKDRTVDVLFYRYADSVVLYYRNKKYTNIAIRMNSDLTKGKLFTSFHEARKYLDSVKSDGVLVYSHDDGPYLLLRDINELMSDIWYTDEDDSAGDSYHAVTGKLVYQRSD